VSSIDIWRFPADTVPGEITNRALAAAEHAVRVEREGAGPGSLTDAGLRYSVLDGHGVLRYATDLEYWIHHHVPALASACCGEPLGISPETRTAINLNVLQGRGEMYELHTDPCPWSALLFCTGPHVGGEWLGVPYDGVTVEAAPMPGELLVFRGSIPHAVLPLADDSTRVSVPVALYPHDVTRIERDPELDAHIFGEESAA
jgi:hypothetical protein